MNSVNTCYQHNLPVQSLVDATKANGDGLADVEGDHQDDEGEYRVQSYLQDEHCRCIFT